MKTTPLIVALAVFGLTANSISASELVTQPKQTKGLVKKEKPLPSPGVQVEKNVALTGSYIKRNIRRQGVVTDGPNPVYVIDHKTINLTGAADLSQVLVRTGFRR